jgi:catechol 2,3-dioxygenase-like lactoylglutathione lyase family enzyme
MLDHVGFAVGDAEVSRRFYEAILAPLGLRLVLTVPAEENGSGGTAHGFGTEGDPFFWIGDNERVGEGTHVAFRADTREQVDAFHEAALAAGAIDNGPPGPRPQYGANYYAAFVRDPDGLNIEAVCHKSIEDDRQAHLHHRL